MKKRLICLTLLLCLTAPIFLFSACTSLNTKTRTTWDMLTAALNADDAEALADCFEAPGSPEALTAITGFAKVRFLTGENLYSYSELTNSLSPEALQSITPVTVTDAEFSEFIFILLEFKPAKDKDTTTVKIACFALVKGTGTADGEKIDLAIPFLFPSSDKDGNLTPNITAQMTEKDGKYRFTTFALAQPA